MLLSPLSVQKGDAVYYYPVPPRIERGMSAVDASDGARVAYCDTYEQALMVAQALNVLAEQQGWLSSDNLRIIGDRCPFCHAPRVATAP